MNKKTNKNDESNNKNKKWKFGVAYIVAVFGLIMLFNYARSALYTKQITYDEFITLLDNKQIQEVSITRDKITIEPKKDTSYGNKVLYTANIGDKDLVQNLKASGVKFSGPLASNPLLLEILISWIGPLLFLLLIGRLMFGKIDKKWAEE